jgi:hypothetical protein
MEALLEILVQGLLELIGELVFDQTFRRAPENGRLRVGFYAVLGLVAGFVSLLILRQHSLSDPAWRIAALVINPALIGFLMMRLGRWRARRKGRAYGLEAFWPAWAFAFGFGLVRVVFAS